MDEQLQKVALTLSDTLQSADSSIVRIGSAFDELADRYTERPDHYGKVLLVKKSIIYKLKQMQQSINDIAERVDAFQIEGLPDNQRKDRLQVTTLFEAFVIHHSFVLEAIIQLIAHLAEGFEKYRISGISSLEKAIESEKESQQKDRIRQTFSGILRHCKDLQNAKSYRDYITHKSHLEFDPSISLQEGGRKMRLGLPFVKKMKRDDFEKNPDATHELTFFCRYHLLVLLQTVEFSTYDMRNSIIRSRPVEDFE